MEKAKVYFSKEISPEKVLEMYKKLGINLPGKLAVKVHSGEEGNQNFLRPEFWKPVIDDLKGTVVECNTAYPGTRNTTKKHTKLMEKHGWSKVFDVDIMDSEGPDVDLPIENGKHLKNNRVGKHLLDYDSLLVLSHFKGHPMGGYGGALKQLSIGCASSAGKCWIHSGGRTHRQVVVWMMTAPQEVFLECMAEAAGTVVKQFEGKCAFINVMCNMSVDCDCCAVAEDPCMKDIGILASLDPVAIDQACVDLVYKSKDPGRDHLIQRIESRKGIHTIEAAVALGYGTREYELIEV
ncbi:MAG: DUF362 domain-containing protein [Clostridiales bacterium]|nr:DUF362 domain-containing protein [Clostridiales bacterium]